MTLRVSSIKTRIKTSNGVIKKSATYALRVYSIKTRIKAHEIIVGEFFCRALRVSSIITRINRGGKSEKYSNSLRIVLLPLLVVFLL